MENVLDDSVIFAQKAHAARDEETLRKETRYLSLLSGIWQSLQRIAAGT